MTASEFDLIARYFAGDIARALPARHDVLLGIGDDAALLAPPPGMALAVSVDTLVAGVHFPDNTDAAAIGHKALAVNLSDLAAMGAEPAWVTLAISLPACATFPREAWLTDFAHSFFALAKQHGVQLVGGDTTRGPLSITVQAMGFVPEDEAMTRREAQVGDAIFVTGTVGDAALGLRLVQGRCPADIPPPVKQTLIARLERPEPRVAAGLALRGLASAAIDVSDGLGADLGHILAASGVGADVQVSQLPRSQAFVSMLGEDDWTLAANAGDDYELCFTVAALHQQAVRQRLDALGLRITRVGEIGATPGLRWRDDTGRELDLTVAGYDHFSAASTRETS
ncbi:MAG: thiamine-phosphate kinase [Gammaproteobacteria bacterium]|nr:thiamine-phosphate kinase [Gammaproteobacteria bacterium]